MSLRAFVGASFHLLWCSLCAPAAFSAPTTIFIPSSPKPSHSLLGRSLSKSDLCFALILIFLANVSLPE